MSSGATCEDSYADPRTGYLVFRESYHLKRGFCCRSVCRHCPWNYRG
ncbi:MAG: DUF5522 domain-containing protein [Proteobacteria bacterium]|nr:DUF5522 domain-containing protein [Pseudomonadota bacterium]